MQLSCQYRLKENLFLGSVKLIKYAAFAINVVFPSPCVGSLLRMKISFLLLICTDELMSTPNIITFLSNPSLSN